MTKSEPKSKIQFLYCLKIIFALDFVVMSLIFDEFFHLDTIVPFIKEFWFHVAVLIIMGSLVVVFNFLQEKWDLKEKAPMSAGFF